MKVRTQISAKRVTPSGEETLRLVSDDFQILDKSTEGLRSANALSSIHADACIYCPSTVQLSSEHVIPFAWGGKVQIHRGSCEECRRVTSQFENYALNDGAMAHVRKALGYPSRSGHKSAQQALGVSLKDQDGQEIEVADDVTTPVILGLPLFVRPGLLVDDGRRTDLRMEGIVGVAFGADVENFLKEHSASAAAQRESGKRVLALARTLAKIAYGWAWRDGVVEKLEGTDQLVNAFMSQPDQIGAYVGTKPPPYERYQGVQLRIEYKLSMPSQLVYMEVQLFADAGAPVYEVVLGRIGSMREWRRLLSSLRT